MTKKLISSLIVTVFTVALSGCVTQEFASDSTPVVKNQANRDDMAATRISLGLGYLKMGNMAQAKQNLEKAKKFAPQMVQVYTAFAHYYETVGESELTIASYEKALSIKRDDADTLNNYGVYLCRQNEIEEAEQQFLKAIAVPSYVLVAKSYENLSSCFLQQDNFEKSEMYLNKAILHSPGNASTLFQMVRLQYAMGKFTLAKTYQQRFEKVTRRFTPQSLALAFKVYWQLGQQRTAKNYGTMLVKMYPQSWEAQQYLLNELEIIEADELAKRYKATQISDMPAKPKKRVVKLSPKKPSAINSPANTVVGKSEGARSKALPSAEAAPKTLKQAAIPTIKSTVNAVPPLIPAATFMTINDALTKGSIDSTVAISEQRAAVNKTTENTIEKNTPVVSEQQVAVNEAPEGIKEKNTPAISEQQVAVNEVPEGIIEQNPLVISEQQTAVSELSESAIEHNKPVVVLDAPKAEESELTKTLAVDNDPIAVVDENLTQNSKTATLVNKDIPIEDQEIFHIAKKPVDIIEDAPKVAEPLIVESTDTLKIKEAGEKPKANTIHVVSSGDTLYGISIKYNIKIKALRRWNNITGNKKIRINDKLHLIDPKTVTK